LAEKQKNWQSRLQNPTLPEFVRSNSIYIERINLPEQIFKLITEKVKEVENE